MTSPVMTMRPARTALAVTVMTALAIGLSGCLDGGSGFAVLDRPAESADALPTDLPDYAFDNLDPESARFVADHDGVELYLTRGADSGICLLAYPNAEDWVVGCSGGRWLKVGGRSTKYEVRADGAPAPEGATALSANVYLLAD
jgi:hypothetical protein